MASISDWDFLFREYDELTRWLFEKPKWWQFRKMKEWKARDPRNDWTVTWAFTEEEMEQERKP